MEKILAFFGAFNPPTSAHIDLASMVMEQLGLREVLYVPSRAAYIRHDQGKDFAFSDAQRLAMLRAAAQSRPWMRVTDMEIRSESQPRTYHTLCRLREEGLQPMLLLGSDKLPELEKGWRHVEEIAREFGIVCMTRGGDDCRRMLREDAYLRTLAPWIRLVQTPDALRGVSSTAVREKLRRANIPWEEIASMVPEEILPLLQPGAAHEGGCIDEA